VSTVSNQPVPPKNVTPKSNITGGTGGNYGRPTSGGPPVAGKSEGNAPTSSAAPGVIPGYDFSKLGAPVSTGGTQAGPDIGAGATPVGPTGDRPSGGKADANLGTVGDSGPQGG
jgi:hypothetical protein